MSDQQPPRPLPLPSETSHITRRRPSEPLPTTPENPHQYIPQHTCSNPHCAAKEVLSTPELLELTLFHLPTTSILPLRHVSKTWHALITTTSPSLRLHLFLEPQWARPSTAFLLLPCTTVPGLQLVRGEKVHLGQWVEARMTPAAARSISRKIYRRPLRSCKKKRIHLPDEFVDGGDDEDGGCASSSSSSDSHLSPQQIPDLLLTQPPLVGVQASVVAMGGEEEDSISRDREASDPNEPKELARSKLACDAGITLGFMAEAANFLLRDLELLASGGQGSGDKKGKQREKEVVVVFRAIVSFCAQTDGAPRMRSGTRFVTKVD
jgi:hypothetical protein